MADTKPTNLTASVRQRLRNRAAKDGVDFQRILTRYGGERLLYRLLHTADGHRFVLKGAVLWTAWEGAERRPTRDVDLLGPGRGTPETMAATFRTACAATVESDGLSFDATSVTATAIREDQDY